MKNEKKNEKNMKIQMKLRYVFVSFSPSKTPHKTKLLSHYSLGPHCQQKEHPLPPSLRGTSMNPAAFTQAELPGYTTTTPEVG